MEHVGDKIDQVRDVGLIAVPIYVAKARVRQVRAFAEHVRHEIDEIGYVRGGPGLLDSLAA